MNNAGTDNLTSLDEQYDIQRMYRRNSGDSQHSAGRVTPIDIHAKKLRRHSYNAASANSDVKYDDSDCDEEIEMESHPHSQPSDLDSRQMYRRHSYNVPSVHSGGNFDESYYGGETAPPPERPAPQVPRVHPKLPDYDELTSRFEALKYQK